MSTICSTVCRAISRPHLGQCGSTRRIAPSSLSPLRGNSIERPRLYGTVHTVSADRLTDDKSGQGYYAVEVALDPNDVKKSRIDLQAGMPAEVIVPTRPRTLFEYLLGPLRDEITRAFRER